jgi:O-antigen ligase
LAVEVGLAAALAATTPLVPLVGLGIAAALLTLIFMPRWAAVVALIIALPSYDFVFFTIGETSDVGVLELGVLIALTKWALDSVREQRFYFDITAFEFPIFLLLGYALFTLLWVPSAPRGIHQGIRVVTGFAVYFLLVNLIRDRRDLERALTTWVLLSTVIAIIAFFWVREASIPATEGLQLREGEVAQLGKTVRVTLFFTQPNGLAFFLSIAVLFSVIRYYWGRSILKKLFHAAAIVLMMLVLAATFSRKSWLGIVLALGIVGLRFPRVLVEGVVAILGAVLLIILSDTGHYSDALWLRFLSLFIEPADSIKERWEAWQIGLELFHKSPLLGNGIGSFWTLSWRLGSPLLMPHNFYVYLLAEVGMLGVSLFVILAVHFAWALWTAMARVKEPYMNFIATLLFGCWLSILFQAAFRTIGLVEPLVWGFLGQTAAFLRLAAAEGRSALPEPEKDVPTEVPEVGAVRVA